ncbi:tryptophanase [Amycolatopsis cihanbeyliensis]|nr:tryptophanase [Amycolatopsis cihanbeyliensis]
MDSSADVRHPAEPWRIKSIESIRLTSAEERRAALSAAGYNVGLLPAELVYIDLYTDSGTGAMSDRQWAAVMLGDESYAGSRSFHRFEAAVRDYYGYPHVIPAHQGRAAEHILSRCLIRPGHHVPGNMYFTTTREHQELNGGVFHDIVIDTAHDPDVDLPFKGNVDLAKLERLIDEVGAEQIPYVSLAATVNMAGGQPISMANLAEVRELTCRHGIPIILDAARAVENAWFIKQREPGWTEHSVAAVLREMCELTDGATMSAKKDSFANIGGWLAVRDPALAERARNLVVVYEGLHTYGGMAGRDLEATAQGIEESVQEDSIRTRVQQVAYLADRIAAAGAPIVRPVGGHAVFLNATAFLPGVPREQFPAQTLTCALYLDAGIRCTERGAVSAGRDPVTGENRYPPLELVRLTIPRRAYTQSHMDVVADSVIRLYGQRGELRSGVEFTHEPETLRFFQSRFRPLSSEPLFGEVARHPAEPAGDERGNSSFPSLVVDRRASQEFSMPQSREDISPLLPTPLMQLATGFWSFKTYAGAIEIGLFDLLAGGRELTMEEVSAELGIAHRPADLLLAGCASLGLLNKSGARYRNSELSEEFLVKGAPYYFGGFVRYLDRREYPAWQSIVEALRTNRPLTWTPGTQESLFDTGDPETLQLFWDCMYCISTFTARALATVYDLTRHTRLLDVGGGAGAFPIELCRRFGHLSATVFELPHVGDLARQKITAANMDGAVDVVAGDFICDPELPRGYDAIILSMILHDWDEETCRTLLRKCRAALPPGGAVLICELLLNDERTGPPAAALMGMNMLVETEGGKNYSAAEYRGWLQEAGFARVEVMPIEAAGANGVVVGHLS